MEKEIQNFKALYYQYYQPLCNHAFKYLSDRDESEDVVQEVLIRFWELKKEMPNDLATRNYLFAAVRNRSISVLRQKNNIRFVPIDGHDVEVTEDINKEQEGENISLLIERAFDDLSPKCAEVFKLSRIEKLKYAEIAAHLGISVKTVENQMGKAIKHMRDFIDKNPLFSIFFMLYILYEYVGVFVDNTFYK
ncbi:RNA polymerase sigma-70 factor [Chryseobacterium sp. L7]|uniref:RNA polymerase sigma-70 factor n=1 Tax=Chryseobacterium endalhagicum TaxID=2797638 RepID=A0ABS1QIS1_9FLAO|nr:RNA polymerase sigma-70 factor [Chryseobacterium endalhagicum]MBL1221964.1 RNA polymerase sigma-70 factor [Chryseobacterium endalhagicum]